jgi:probable F420-dependent oxidoreductase
VPSICYERLVQYAAVFPTNEIGDDPGAVRDWAQTAEGLGFSTIAAYDHVLGAVHAGRDPKLWGPYTEKHPFHEPFVLFGFLAALTNRVTLQTAVVIAPQRQTALLAKQAVQADILSGGRLVLGLGTGWNYVEYEALGMPFDQRGVYLDEQVEVLRLLFSEPLVDYAGRFHRIDRAGLLPLPERRIPIWFGGGSEPALRRAARSGDGFVFGFAGDRTNAMVVRLRELLAEHGRDADSFPITAPVQYVEGPEAWLAQRDAFAAAGGTEFGVQTMDTVSSWRGGPLNGFTTASQHIAALERFAQELAIPR